MLQNYPYESSPPAARHYNSALSIWLSVDPMSDKYPSLSPYTYCGNNPVIITDPNGMYGVIELSPKQDIVWRGKVRVSMPVIPIATLRMTYYYSTGTTAGSLSLGEIIYVATNIARNLNPLVGQPISINGKNYYFNYHIKYVGIKNASDWDLYKKAENTTYDGYKMGNYIQSGSISGDDVGYGSQYSMIIDFNKMIAGFHNGSCDGQTATHEFFHNIGADDTGVYAGTNIMDWNMRIVNKNEFGIEEITPTPKREVNIRDMEKVINQPSYSDRIHIINE